MSARLFKRDGIWFAWVPKPGGGTRRQTTGCTDKKAAELRAAQLEREALDPSYAAANQATTSDACEGFLASRISRGRSEGTLHHYRVKLGHVVRLMPARLADVDALACERFIAKRLSEGAAQTTVKKEIRALGATLRHAARMGTYLRIVDAVIPELEDTYKPRERFLMPLEFVALLGSLPAERAARVVFIVATGARWGESDRARLEDILEGNAMVNMRGTKTKRSKGVAPVPPPMRQALSWSLARAHQEVGQPIFAPWSNVRRDLLKACNELGIDPVTPNDLRRTYATWLRVSGVATDLIGAALRHTTSRMAELCYGRINPTDLNRLISERYATTMINDEKESSGPGLHMGDEVTKTGAPEVVRETFKVSEKAVKQSAQGRNRTADTGIFNPEGTTQNADESGIPAGSRAANGLSFGARARRFLTRRAA